MKQLGGGGGAEGKRSAQVKVWIVEFWSTQEDGSEDLLGAPGGVCWCSWSKKTGVMEKFPPPVTQCWPGCS